VATSALGERLAEPRARLIVAHIPTGLWLLSSVADLLAIAIGRNVVVRFAWLAQVVGVLGTLALHLARPAATEPNASPELRDLAHLHAWLNNALPVVFGVSAGLRSGPALNRARPPAPAVALTLAGVGGLFLSRELARRRESFGVDVPNDGVVGIGADEDRALVQRP
jgi:hypothetical protein